MSPSHAPAELSLTGLERSGAPPAGDALGGGASAVRVLRPRRAAPADAVRPTRAEVNLAHLRHNLRVLERAVAGAARPQIWGVLKADAYGHGAPAVARTLERAGIAGLCVALLEEAVELRDAGIRIPILVMGGYYGPRREGFEEIVARDLTPVVYDAGQIERLANFARFEGYGRVGVHLKVDTGMGRLGAGPEDLDAVLEALARHPEVRLDGLMTHLACADADDLGDTLEQMRRFQEMQRQAKEAGLSPRVLHASNSAAMLRLPEARLDLVRPGVALFGIAPRAGLAPELRPVMRVRSEVVALRTIAKGERIGYGHTWEAPRRSVVATVPMGYADGLSRQLSNRGSALVRGARAPIAGAVSMDLTMLDVTELPGIRAGDEVVFLGAQEGPLGRDAISASEIADATGTIPWEVLTSISRRVPRFYREP
jgi:alanine racemase